MVYTIWLTGLPCSGKTTLAKAIESRLKDKNFKIIHLDGDDVRKSLNSDLGFSKEDREENLRRVATLAQLLNEKGYNVVASFVSPIEKQREMIKRLVTNIIFVYVKCSLERCKKRDVKKMYKKAESGIIKNFTGVSDVFEEPKISNIIVNTEKNNLNECLDKILKSPKLSFFQNEKI